MRRILISFGGADAGNVTGLAVSAFASLGRSDVIADVVLSAGSPHTRSLRAQIEGLPNIDLHHGLPTLAPLIARADLAIGAGGATTWERLCLGLPTLMVTLAANQHAIARELDERGLVRWLGDQEALERSELARALDEILASGLGGDWSRRCLARVDGGGTRRVAAALMSDAMTPLIARHATPGDERLLLDWANDPLTRANAFSPDPITPQVHKEWFRKRLREIDACRLFIIQTEEEVPIGQVRFERAEEGWEVHYGLSPLFRGRRLGLPMLRSALARLPPDESAGSVFGKVKIDNKPSQRIFERLGFTRELLADEKMLVYRKALA